MTTATILLIVISISAVCGGDSEWVHLTRQPNRPATSRKQPRLIDRGDHSTVISRVEPAFQLASSECGFGPHLVSLAEISSVRRRLTGRVVSQAAGSGEPNSQALQGRSRASGMALGAASA